ncbi:TonB-dependent receptor [Novosphingobium sp. CCH12-A3]|uniref:TonB-dependent receptor n=1 Tax=Novosphingobium sp. CCH12-A3 TaxID=1768752 RepID=UPI000AA196FC
MKARFTSASVFALAASILAVPAFAQETAQADNAGGIEEIVVTAQKRVENVQDVPIAISAFGGTALKERAVADISALSGIAPNVNLDGGTPFSGSSAVLSATIRGIGSDDFAFNIDPGVGIYLDGVFLARTVGANQDLPDVERIEVLKGPQGTLFGRNTIGGAISIVTHNPGKEFRLTGDLTTGSFDLLRARATLDLPLTDGLAASLTGAVTSRSGFQKRIPYNGSAAEMRAIANSDPFTSFNNADYSTSSRQSADNNLSLRGKLRWDDGGAFRATLSGDYTNQDSSGQNNSLLGVSFPPGPAGTVCPDQPPARNRHQPDRSGRRLPLRRALQLLHRLDSGGDRRTRCQRDLWRAWHQRQPRSPPGFAGRRQHRRRPHEQSPAMGWALHHRRS